MHNNNGFTLVELMITLAVAAILLTTAIPSFQTMVSNNRLVNEVNRFNSDLAFARSEAVKSGHVVVCRSSNPDAASPTCDSSAANAQAWEKGWLVFLDKDRNGTLDTDDVRLAVGKATINGLSLRANSAAANQIAFNKSGHTIGADTPVFALCDDRAEKYGRQITVTPAGKTRLESGSISDCEP